MKGSTSIQTGVGTLPRRVHTQVHWLSAVMLAWLLFFPARLNADSDSPKEYQIKAIYLINFMRFVQWPPAIFPKPDTPIRLGILGEDPFGSDLDDATRTIKIRERKVIIERSRQVDELKDCQLIFICRSEQSRLEEIMSAIGKRPILVVSDIKQFADHGGMIGLFFVGKKIHFEVNQTSVDRQKLKMSAELLSCARIVDPDGKKGPD